MQVRNTDEENFSQAIAHILVMREGLNLVHILTDQEKSEEANALAGSNYRALPDSRPLPDLWPFS